MKPRLHYHPVSPYSLKARIATLHRADAVDFQVVDVRGGGLRSPEFRALSPFGKMPVLETAEGPVIESTSIIELLEEQGPRVLLPQGQERVARHFDRLGDLYLIDPMSALWWRPGSPEAQSAPATAATAWALFARQLQGRAFICGSALSLGDLSGAIGTEYLERLGVTAPEPVRAWKERCFAVPALARVREEAAPIMSAMLAARGAPAAVA